MYTPCGTKKHLFDINSLQVKFLFFVQETHHRGHRVSQSFTEFHREKRKAEFSVLSVTQWLAFGFWFIQVRKMSND